MKKAEAKSSAIGSGAYGIWREYEGSTYWFKRMEEKRFDKTAVWTMHTESAMRFKSLKAAREYIRAEELRGEAGKIGGGKDAE